MQLLLLLSALFASLTGVVAGDRDVRGVERNAPTISRSADAKVEAVAQVAIALIRPNSTQPHSVAAASFAIFEAPTGRPARLTSERRLE